MKHSKRSSTTLFLTEAYSYRRRPKHPDFLPTDEQAEVLIPGRIDRSDVIAVAVRDDEQARDEAARMRLMDSSLPELVVVPEFFDPPALTRKIREGVRPQEHIYEDGKRR